MEMVTLDFTRSTAATRVNADGNIEKETQNLLTHSGDLTNANWSIINSATYNGTETDPNGGNKAYSFTGGSTNSAVRQTNALSGGVYTFSVYLKSPTSAPINIRLDSNNGTFENYPCGLTTEWQRFEFYYVHNSASLSAWIGGGLSWTTGEEVHIAFPQLEQGLVARDYIETTTTALYGGITDNVPRLDYTDSSCPALLLEPLRTNLITQSEYLTGTAATPSYNQITSPEGVYNGVLLIENTAATSHGLLKGSVIATNANPVDYTISIFAKKKEREYIQFTFFSEGTLNNSDYFNLINGTTNGDASTHKIEDYGNGWYRCSYTQSITQSTGGYNFARVQIGQNSSSSYYQGDGTSGLYFYGWQLEAGSYRNILHTYLWYECDEECGCL